MEKEPNSKVANNRVGPNNSGYDDENHDYIIRPGEKFNDRSVHNDDAMYMQCVHAFAGIKSSR